jgi:hypothetical protein
MNIDIIQIIVIIVVVGLCYWANDQLNKVPVLINVVRVLIVVIAVLLLLQSLGVMGSSHFHVGN